MAKEPITVEPLTMTHEQRVRMATAMAVFDAKRAALKAGMSVAEVDAQVWHVDVDPFHTRAV
jgi:hypothetical protein